MKGRECSTLLESRLLLLLAAANGMRFAGFLGTWRVLGSFGNTGEWTPALSPFGRTIMLRHTLVLAAVLLGTAGSARADSWADALFDGLSHDFGTTQHGLLRTHTFTITNTTGKPVHIASARVSCGCLSTALSRYDIPPGETGYLVVNMDTNRFNGVWAKVVYVRFDQPESAEVRLTIQANSRGDVTVTPTALAFGQVTPGAEAKANVTLTLGEANVSIVNVQTDSGFIEAKATPLPREGGSATFQITAQLRPNLPVGSWYSTVWLTTNNSTMARVSIPVTVEVKAPSAPPKVAPTGSK
jgi:hypothetical protein